MAPSPPSLSDPSLLWPQEPSFSKDQHLFTHINSTHARLNLQGWSNGGCPITAIALEFRPKGTWAWQGLQANTSGEVFLTELREATWYELRMRACNSAGCGNETAQFATLDYDGSESGRGGTTQMLAPGAARVAGRERLTKRKISRTIVRRKADRWVQAKAAADWQAGGALETGRQTGLTLGLQRQEPCQPLLQRWGGRYG